MELSTSVAVIAAAAAIVGGLVTAVVGPVVKHKLDARATELDRRRQKIHRWRELVSRAAKAFQDGQPIKPLLEADPSFHDLVGYLTEERKQEVFRESPIYVIESSLQHPLKLLSEEIARLERQWGLRK